MTQSALFIGRFQPFHNGHLLVVKRILEENERVIMVIGSAEKNFLPGNPLTAGERIQLIEAALKEAKIPAEKYLLIPIRNVNNYAIWVNHINVFVPPYTKLYTGSEIVQACYEGKYSKSHRTNKIGPEIIMLDRELGISATKIREAITEDKDWESMIPKAVVKLLKEWEIPQRLQTIQHTLDITKYNNRY